MKQFLRRLFRGKKEEFVLVYAQISDLFYSENCYSQIFEAWYHPQVCSCWFERQNKLSVCAWKKLNKDIYIIVYFVGYNE